MARADAHAAQRSAEPARVRSAAPTYAAVLKGARQVVGCSVKDRFGVERLDICNAEGAVLLGWADPRVETAVAKVEAGRRLEAEAAERLGALVPCAEAVGFRGSLNAALADALTAAKTVTGRDGAFFCDDETTAAGDSDAVADALARHVGEVAALVIRPMEASAAFLAACRRLTLRDGVVLVFDESRTLFRLHRGGAQGLHAITPDLTVMGASIANGRPIGAVAGKVEPMRAVGATGPRATTAALAAACATLDRVVRDDVPEVLTVRGAEIEAEVGTRLARTGADAWFATYGDPTWSLVAARPRLGLDAEGLEAALAAALYAEGVLSFGAHVPSLATGPAAIARLIGAYERALPPLAERAARGEFSVRLRRSALAR